MADVFDLYVKDNRTIQFKFTEPIMLEDSHVTDWVFHIPRILNNLDVSGWAWWLVYINARGRKYSELLELSEDPESPLEKCIATYSVDYGMSIKAGIVRFSLEAINTDTGGEILNEWHTQTYQAKVQDTLQGNQVEFAETESDIISALIVEVQNKVAQLVGGATPEPKNLVADMTDPKKVYLYVGSEDGESTNYWYYHNGTRFVPGGLYASGITVDSVPTQGSNNAVRSGGVYSALASKVDAVSGKGLSTNDYTNVDKQAVTDATTDLTAMTTATAEDVGKALKAKTVTNGKVIEWEFGEAGGGADASLTAEVESIKSDVYAFGTVVRTISPTINTGYGYLKNGTTRNYSTMRCTDYIDVSGWISAVVTAFNSDGDWAGVCYFDDNYDFVSYTLGDGGSGTNVEITIPSGVKYMTLTMLGNNPTCTATRYKTLLEVKTEIDSVVDAENLPDPSKTVAENVTDTMNKAIGASDDVEQVSDDFYHSWGTVTETLTPAVTSREYYKISDGTVGSYPVCNRTDLIDIIGWASATVTCYGLATNYAGVCYYDKNRNYISGEYSDGRYTDAPLHIPTNAKYIGVSSHNSFTITLTVTRYVTPTEVSAVVNDLKSKVLDGYLDKNVVLFGDSITTESHKYVPALKQIMGFKSLTNYARGYCKWSFYADTVYDITSTGNTGSSDNVIWNQYNRLVADVANEVVSVPDAIIIMAGTNDAIYTSEVGTVADAMAIADIRSAQVGTLNNVCASIRRVIEDISATFPYTKIVICTPIQSGKSGYQTRLNNIVPCIREICGYYSIDVPDMFRDVGISYYIEKDADVYLSAGDGGVHPTEAGGKLMANFMKAWLTSHYSYDETITKTYVAQS